MKIEKEKMMKIIRNDQQNNQNNQQNNDKLMNVPTLIQYEKNHIKKQKIRNRIQKLSNNDMKDERNFPKSNQNQNNDLLPSYSSSFIWGQSYQYKNRPTSHPNYHVRLR